MTVSLALETEQVPCPLLGLKAARPEPFDGLARSRPVTRLPQQPSQGSVTQAHIHFGQRHTVGGIVVWLCETDAATHPNPLLRRPVTPQCPGAGTVIGTVGPEKVIDVAGQGIAAGEFAELLRAIRAGTTYANVHSSVFPPGEIRGQVDEGHRH